MTDLVSRLRQDKIELEQCSLFVDSKPLKSAMTDAAKSCAEAADEIERLRAGLESIQEVCREEIAEGDDGCCDIILAFASAALKGGANE